MKMKIIYSAVAVALLIGVTACTQTKQSPEATIASIKKTLAANLGDGAKIDEVTKTNYAGLYEVHIGHEVIYTDEKAEFLFVGSVLSAKGDINHTKSRVEELSKVKFSELPLELAMKVVRGKGERIIAIFEDPHCGYCKQLRKNIQGLENVTIYTFMYNILSEESHITSKNVWCSSDKTKAWDDWMILGKEPAVAGDDCKTPNDQVYELGRKLRVSGTPTIIFSDGTRTSGALTVEMFEQKFLAIKTVMPK
jgi:thiol:disulfide interchange protein DsbC